MLEEHGIIIVWHTDSMIYSLSGPFQGAIFLATYNEKNNYTGKIFFNYITYGSVALILFVTGKKY
jgi:hypothetical protein